MAGTSEDTLDEVIRFLWQNQKNSVDGEKKNYLQNIADELDLHKDTVARAIDWLEGWGLVKTWKDGVRKYARITWNPEKSPKAEELLDE